MKAMNLYHYNKENAEKVEILAPAGSFDIMKAVIQAGADAVYLGGDFFGARAFAGNFHEEELIEAIHYAHQFDRKIYLTVNTLLKESEINSRLIHYLKPYYEAGLDAVIVQDFGVFDLIRKHFPDLHIHASTQMTQTGPEGAEILYKAGATRVVTSRELNCSEIKAIHDRCNVEIESFVHGALCYCYSGQCLMSSFNGGRSGNRGRCAQPCRLPYDVEGVNTQGKKYVLSPKDMCALPVLPDVVEAGVYSLKIEGRMKNVTYAAGVTAIYRKYVDMYLQNGRKGYHIDEEDMNHLMDLYNRGAFTEGYYTRDKGEQMISLTRPNHMGTKALRVVENVNGRITFQALEPIHAHDVFEIDKEHSFSSGEAVQTGERFVVNLPKRYPLAPGTEVYRTRNDMLTEWVKNSFVGEHLKVKADMSYTAMTDCPMSLTIYTQDESVTIEGPIVTKAMKQPASEEKIMEQLRKLGDTILEAEHIEVILSEDAFVPASQLNELRREAAGELVRLLRERGSRTAGERLCEVANTDIDSLTDRDADENLENKQIQSKSENDMVSECDGNQDCSGIKKHVLIENLNLLDVILEYDSVTEVYFDYNLIYENEEKLIQVLNRIHEHRKKAILALPHILKAKNEELFANMIDKAEAMNLDGYLVRNMEELGHLGKIKTKSFVYTDAGLYIANTHSKKRLIQFAADAGVNIERMTLPYELTAGELETVAQQDTELMVYGQIPMMLSEQCVKKTFGKCDHKNGCIHIESQGNQYLVQSRCRFCYTITYDIRKLDIRCAEEIGTVVRPGSVRIELSDESEDELRLILEDRMLSDTQSLGHFYRGVE